MSLYPLSIILCKHFVSFINCKYHYDSIHIILLSSHILYVIITSYISSTFDILFFLFSIILKL